MSCTNFSTKESTWIVSVAQARRNNCVSRLLKRRRRGVGFAKAIQTFHPLIRLAEIKARPGALKIAPQAFLRLINVKDIHGEFAHYVTASVKGAFDMPPYR